MRTFVMAMAIIAAALPARAGVSSGWVSGPVVVVAVAAPRPVAVAIVMPADFVSVPIGVVSDQKNTALAYDESRQAIELIRQRVKEDGKFRTSTGVVSLSEHKSSFGISSGSWSQSAAKTEIYLLVPLTKDRNDIFAAGAEAARFLGTLRFPAKVRCDLGHLQLALENPEQYRTKLLGLIAQEIKQTRETMSAQGNVKVDGLESPVIVRQTDDRQVDLFLNYALSITMDK